MEIVCPACKRKSEKRKCDVERAKAAGLNIYCNRVCAGIGRRNGDTLQKVKSGHMEPGQGDAIASQAREILRTTVVQLKVASQSNRSISQDVLDFAENRKQKQLGAQ
jgi:hypothetical protein